MNPGDIALSIGGDNYCYADVKKYVMLHSLMKEKGAKIAAIWCQDWSGQITTEFGSQVYWNWEHDTTLYHDLDKAIEELNRDNVKFLGYINTFLKQDANLYNYAKEHDFLVKNKDGNPYLIKSTTFYAGIVDLTTIVVSIFILLTFLIISSTEDVSK